MIGVTFNQILHISQSQFISIYLTRLIVSDLLEIRILALNFGEMSFKKRESFILRLIIALDLGESQLN